MYNTTYDVQEYWVPSKTKKRKNGEPAIFPNVVRKMFLADPNGWQYKQYRITQVRRKGEVKYSIYGLFEPVKPFFYSPLVHGTADYEPYWKKAEESKTRTELLQWLVGMAANPEATVSKLEVMPPIKEAA